MISSVISTGVCCCLLLQFILQGLRQDMAREEFCFFYFSKSVNKDGYVCSTIQCLFATRKRLLFSVKQKYPNTAKLMNLLIFMSAKLVRHVTDESN